MNAGNGKVLPRQSVLVGMGIAVVLSVIVGITGYMWISVIELREFAARGHTFTRVDGRALAAQVNAIHQLMIRLEVQSFNQDKLIDAIETELRRLQLQIDRLEGHEPLTYTEDK